MEAEFPPDPSPDTLSQVDRRMAMPPRSPIIWVRSNVRDQACSCASRGPTSLRN